jgi:hypothetical protein
MPRPQIIVTVTGAIARRGAPTDTGPAFVAYAAATGPTDPVTVTTSAAAAAAGVPDSIAAWIGDLLTQGTPRVTVVKAAATDPVTATEIQWTNALDKFVDTLGPGQVLIPGVATAAAQSALLAHAHKMSRCVLLDAAKDATATTIATTATALHAAEGAEYAGMVVPWVTVPGPGGIAREVPGSIIGAGLAAREDAVAGHANSAPAGDKGYNAGAVRGGIAPTKLFSNSEHDTLHDAGVSVIRDVRGTPTLWGWVSLSDQPVWRQLSSGRMAMQIATGIKAGVEKFEFRNVDGERHLVSEVQGFLRGYLTPLWKAGALYGATADTAFDVNVDGNTDATAAAGELVAATDVKLSQHAETIRIAVLANTPEGA